MSSAPLTHLGELPVAQFMRRFWQRRALLVRRALPDFSAPVERSMLLSLAARDDVESRLVTSFDGWKLRHGPIARRSLPRLDQCGWTLLVQGVDQHLERAAELLARFRFAADARLDDLMVSYATDGGGVGPHVDAYDVFLLQARGRRRWRIGRADPDDLVPGLPLAILRRFVPSQEWILEPGDLLYLPPGVAHEGTAVGTGCITCSVGFRAPAWRELVQPWLDTIGEAMRPPGRYRDRGARPARNPASLPESLVDAAFIALTARRPVRTDAVRMLLAALSEPKPNVVFDARPRRTPAGELMRRARSCGLRLDRRSRMLYKAAAIGLNGDVFVPGTDDRRTLCLLADRRALSAGEVAVLTPAAWADLAQWHDAGWIHVGAEATTDRGGSNTALTARAAKREYR